jgi:hypothetical protein
MSRRTFTRLPPPKNRTRSPKQPTPDSNRQAAECPPLPPRPGPPGVRTSSGTSSREPTLHVMTWDGVRVPGRRRGSTVGPLLSWLPVPLRSGPRWAGNKTDFHKNTKPPKNVSGVR